MKRLKLIANLLLLCAGSNLLANPVSDFVSICLEATEATFNATGETLGEIGSFIKGNTWDAQIGSHKNGGKILTCTAAALIAADYAWAKYKTNQDRKKYRLNTIPHKTYLAKLDRKICEFVHPKYKETIAGTLGAIITTVIMQKTMQSMFEKNKLNLVTSTENFPDFNSIVGADEAKKELQNIKSLFLNNQQNKSFNITPPSGIILHGPPGTGKTELARAMAKELGGDATFIALSGASFNTEWRGSGVKVIKDIQATVGKSNGPVVVFIDEINACISNSNGGHDWDIDRKNTIEGFKAWLDGFSKNNINKPLYLIGATNTPINQLDTAIRSRLKTIEVSAPTPEQLMQIGAKEIRKICLNPDQEGIKINWNEIISKLSSTKDTSLTGRDIAKVVNGAAIKAYNQNRHIITEDDLRAAIPA